MAFFFKVNKLVNTSLYIFHYEVKIILRVSNSNNLIPFKVSGTLSYYFMLIRIDDTAACLLGSWKKK